MRNYVATLEADKQEILATLAAAESREIQWGQRANVAEAERDKLREGLKACDQSHRNLEAELNHFKTNMAGIIEASPRVKKLEAENKQLREALEKYGRHRSGYCRMTYIPDVPCDCGLAEALNKADTNRPRKKPRHTHVVAENFCNECAAEGVYDK